MDTTVQLSIILTTHAGNQNFEFLMESILGFKPGKFELIIINDAADDVTSRFIQKEIGKSNNELVYLFEHDKLMGRGACLNEALIHSTGGLIWAPLRADRLNESLLHEAIRRFKSAPASFWALDYTLPVDFAGWISAAEEGELPNDSCLVWNRDVIEPGALFFNPFLNNLHGAELALRLHRNNVWHQTDPFFVVGNDQSVCAPESDVREFLFSAFRNIPDTDTRELILQRLAESGSDRGKNFQEDDYLLQARKWLNQGDAKKSLELINRYLKKNPNHHEANRIKITSLEKQRRHVEAAELKHDLQKRSGMQSVQPEMLSVPASGAGPKVAGETNEHAPPQISVVIPTTGLGKPLLENALLHLEKAADPGQVELIIIDNASIDDTLDYLSQLKDEEYMNLKVITNQANRGFAASVNQGIEAAGCDHILIMHNDVSVSENCVKTLREALPAEGNRALSVPVLNVSEIEQQTNPEPGGNRFLPIDRADSCCFMIRKKDGIFFDQEYRLCQFEMDDYCNQIHQQNLDIVIAAEASAEHNIGTTTGFMGIDLSPHIRWQNRDYYRRKWNLKGEFAIPSQGSHPDRFEFLGMPDNPVNPDSEWKQSVQNYLTDEVRTEILRTKWADDDLITIVTTLIMADERELLRTLEDRLDHLELTPSLLILFIIFYFEKNIYSRCKHYLDRAGDTHPVFDLYRLKILVADKEHDEATPLLNSMLEKFPANPHLFSLAGDLYRQSGDEGEARSFYAMANQLDPFRFRTDEAAFEIRH